jgi:hypothetical protein
VSIQGYILKQYDIVARRRYRSCEWNNAKWAKHQNRVWGRCDAGLEPAVVGRSWSSHVFFPLNSSHLALVETLAFRLSLPNAPFHLNSNVVDFRCDVQRVEYGSVGSWICLTSIFESLLAPIRAIPNPGIHLRNTLAALMQVNFQGPKACMNPRCSFR